MNISVSILAALLLSAIGISVMGKLVSACGLMRKNFKGKVIPAGYGFLVVMVAAPIYAAAAVKAHAGARYWLLTTVVVGYGLVGLLDDVYGNRDAGGFRGHFGLLKQGKVSTGLVKAVVGGLLGFVVGFAASGGSIVAGVTNGLVINLSANLLNLLDLRPGRAVSCFWAGAVLLVLLHSGSRVSIFSALVPIVVPAAIVSVLDRSARVMLGDAGSNVLGAVLGLCVVYETDLQAKVVLILLMLAVHLYSEKYSISKLIESNRVLRNVDRFLGER